VRLTDGTGGNVIWDGVKLEKFLLLRYSSYDAMWQDCATFAVRVDFIGELRFSLRRNVRIKWTVYLSLRSITSNSWVRMQVHSVFADLWACYVIVRPLSTVEYTSVASLFHCRQWSD